MRKIVALSSLVILLFQSTIYADRLEHRKHGYIKQHKQKSHHKAVNQSHRDSRHIGAYKNSHRPKSHTRRPHQSAVNHRIGHRVKHLHRSATFFTFSGIGYGYANGIFYRPYNNWYSVVRAPIGAVIHDLPYGYTTIYTNNQNYYRYNDIYYERNLNRGYRVVEPPRRDITHNSIYRYQVGDVALNLPVGAVEIIIDGRHYFKHEGEYFLPSRRGNKTIYTVVNMPFI